MSNSNTIIVIGASGFIGKYLVESLCKDSSLNIRLLMHKSTVSVCKHVNINQVNGDLSSTGDLEDLITTGSIVINLAYLANNTPSDNYKAIENLVSVCNRKGVSRIIHCSTAVVVGNAKNYLIDEATICCPYSKYEKTKYEIERIMREKTAGKTELAILRPTAVFGPGGLNLIKLAQGINNGNGFNNYLKASLFQERSMNLVCVGNVVSALLFLAYDERKMSGDTYIISDDENAGNNYRYIDNFLRDSWKINKYALPLLPVPGFLYSVIMRLAGRRENKQNSKYSSRKIMDAGFKKTHIFEDCLSEFSEWYSIDNAKSRV